MTHGVIIRVPFPIEAYQAARAEIAKVLGPTSPEGLIVHVARATDAGFEMFEVWESKEHSERFNDEIAGPAVNRSGVPPEGPHAVFETSSRCAWKSPGVRPRGRARTRICRCEDVFGKAGQSRQNSLPSGSCMVMKPNSIAAWLGSTR
jgi:hypothetical protein